MEAQLQHPRHGHHHHEEDPQDAGLHSVIEGEGEHHHGEKKSVLKKVKDKAKKIKNTIKNQGHGHGHEHEHEVGHRRGDIYQEGHEEEDGDDEVENDPEVHGAPMYESTVVRDANIPRETITNLEKPTDRREDRYEQNVRDRGMSQPFAHRAPEFGRPMEAHGPENRSSLPTSLDPIVRDKPINVEESQIKIGSPVGLEEDPHSPSNSPADVPPSNYQSKVTDPSGAGGKEADVAPLVHHLDNLNIVHGAPVSSPSTESHDRFAPQPTPTHDQFNPELNPKGQDSTNTGAMPMDSTLAGKISSATSAVASKAVSAKEMVSSKLGYSGDHQEGKNSSSYKSVSEYARKAAETLAPVYEKVAGTGSAEVHGSGGAEHEGGDTSAAIGANGASMKEYLSEKFRPGDEDKALSEVITNAFNKKKKAVSEKGEKQVGKVTMSEEVAARLGGGAENKREGEDAVAAGQESSGQGVVDRLRDAVGSWLGKSSGMQTAQDSIGRSYGSSSGGVGQDEGNKVQPSRITKQ